MLKSKNHTHHVLRFKSFSLSYIIHGSLQFQHKKEYNRNCKIFIVQITYIITDTTAEGLQLINFKRFKNNINQRINNYNKNNFINRRLITHYSHKSKSEIKKII